MTKLHQCRSNEKQVSGPALKIFHLHAPEIDHQIWSTPMICINYYNPVPSGLFILWICNEDAQQSATCGAKKELRRNRGDTMWPMWCTYFVSVWRQQISGCEIKTQVGVQRKGKEEGWGSVSEAPLWIISRYICHVSPAHGGSNGAPWPGLCALLSALWKSPENSGQKHILTHTPDIHLDPNTAGSELSPRLNVVPCNNSTWLGSWSTNTHVHVSRAHHIHHKYHAEFRHLETEIIKFDQKQKNNMHFLSPRLLAAYWM